MSDSHHFTMDIFNTQISMNFSEGSNLCLYSVCQWGSQKGVKMKNR